MSKDTQPKPLLSNPKRAIGIVLQIIGLSVTPALLILLLFDIASFRAFYSEHVPEFLALVICGFSLGAIGHYLEQGGW